MQSRLSRREFLKLLGTTALSFTTSSRILTNNQTKYGDSKHQGPNVLILLFDSLSARHMSLYGYQRRTTPHIAEFANHANVYHEHYSSGNFTSPATASILTGVYPWKHRAINLNGIVRERFADHNLFSLVGDDYYISGYTHNPLAGVFLNQFRSSIELLHPMESLSLAGDIYAEKFFPKDFPVAFWSENILRGSDQFIPGSLFYSQLDSERLENQINRLGPYLKNNYPDGIPHNFKGMYFLLEQAIDWIMDQLSQLPDRYLAYYHLWPPHDPYLPRTDFKDIFNDGKRWIRKPDHVFSLGISDRETDKQRQKYDEYIAFVDSEFGRLFNFMQENGILDNTMVVLTSDHGDLFERGITGHLNSTLYQDLLHVPLIISLPKQVERQDTHTPTSCVDLLPTILQFTGNKIPDFVEGQVLPGFNPRPNQGERSVFALEAKLNSKIGPLEKCTLAMFQGRYKYIHSRGYSEEIEGELYDLENDPEELENLSPYKRSIANELLVEITSKLESVNSEIF
jgi:arylsulfatase A-like enzyme